MHYSWLRFGANTSGYRLDVIAQSRYRHAQFLQSKPNARDIVTKHKYTPELIRFAANAHNCAGKVVAAIKYSVNSGVFINGLRVHTRHNVRTDGNLMADIWEYL